MSQDEIIVDKVNFIKRIAEKYDLVYEEHIQKNGIKDFSLYFDKENKYKISGYDFYVFNIIIDGLRLDQNTVEILCRKHNLKVVPTILKDYVIPQSFEIHDLVNVAKGKSKLLDTQDREGLVFRNYHENISFKAISPDFLLKEIKTKC